MSVSVRLSALGVETCVWPPQDAGNHTTFHRVMGLLRLKFSASTGTHTIRSSGGERLCPSLRLSKQCASKNNRGNKPHDISHQGSWLFLIMFQQLFFSLRQLELVSPMTNFFFSLLV